MPEYVCPKCGKPVTPLLTYGKPTRYDGGLLYECSDCDHAFYERDLKRAAMPHDERESNR